MPNWSHGLAGIAASLAVAGIELDRPGPGRGGRAAARSTSSPSVTPATAASRCPHVIPAGETRHGRVTYTLVPRPDRHLPAVRRPRPRRRRRSRASRRAAGSARCLHCVRTSGHPRAAPPRLLGQRRPLLRHGRRRRRRSSTPGSGSASTTTSPSPHPRRRPRRPRRSSTATGRCWRFAEHRNDDPLLPPGVGWMQGAAGIAAYLFRLARVLREGRTTPPRSRASTPGGTCPSTPEHPVDRCHAHPRHRRHPWHRCGGRAPARRRWS